MIKNKFNNHSNQNSQSGNKANAEQSSTEQVVLFNTYASDDDNLIGEIILNVPKSLNALSAIMCQKISEQLSLWQQDTQVMAIVLRGSGDKAFCAGGDIRKLYDSMIIKNAPYPNPYATEFFGNEYALLRQMHFYTKPLILWGNGIIMGGGMGLMAACSHRIVTPKTRFAMPEINIGLFPDASGSWFLQRMPAKTGLFLGLTGAQCNASDALVANLAEYVLPDDAYEQLIQALTKARWHKVAENLPDAVNIEPKTIESKTIKSSSSRLPRSHRGAYDVASHTLHDLMQQLVAVHRTKSIGAQLNVPASKLVQHWQAINTLMNAGGLKNIDALLQDDKALHQLDGRFAEDAWVQQAINNYRQGCPVTAALAYELYERVADLSFEQILYLETNVAVNCASNPDFKEGVRALLIDKDKSPKWSKTLTQCLTKDGQAYIANHFTNPYFNDNHPFKGWLTSDAYGIKLVSN